MKIKLNPNIEKRKSSSKAKMAPIAPNVKAKIYSEGIIDKVGSDKTSSSV